jgi:hypothetical protein
MTVSIDKHHACHVGQCSFTNNDCSTFLDQICGTEERLETVITFEASFPLIQDLAQSKYVAFSSVCCSSAIPILDDLRLTLRRLFWNTFVRSSIAQLRMIEVLTELAGRSHGSLSTLEKAGLLDLLKNGLDAADILTRFNVIEILSEVGSMFSGHLCGMSPLLVAGRHI